MENNCVFTTNELEELQQSLSNIMEIETLLETKFRNRRISVIWGYDTFSREDYIAGASFSESKAKQTVQNMEPNSDDESLCDTFSIINQTIDYILNHPILGDRSSRAMIYNFLRADLKTFS